MFGGACSQSDHACLLCHQLAADKVEQFDCGRSSSERVRSDLKIVTSAQMNREVRVLCLRTRPCWPIFMQCQALESRPRNHSSLAEVRGALPLGSRSAVCHHISPCEYDRIHRDTTIFALSGLAGRPDDLLVADSFQETMFGHRRKIACRAAP